MFLIEITNENLIRIGDNTIIKNNGDDSNKNTTFFSAIRNLISSSKYIQNEGGKEYSANYFAPYTIATKSETISKYIRKQRTREQKAINTSIHQFTRSAYYMGSKRSLCGFLVEAISSVLPKSGIVVDLMCGSGVVSGACNNIWKTYASDAQMFCRALATIHGGGLDSKSANQLIEEILFTTKKHFHDLDSKLNGTIEREQSLFCRDSDERLLIDYRKYIDDFPTLPNKKRIKNWDPVKEVSLRKKNFKLYPYCLFTTYFSNVYFGARQSIEIDSLRYSIETINDNLIKNYALGALIQCHTERFRYNLWRTFCPTTNKKF